MLLNEKKNHYLRAGLVLTGLMAALALLGCVWTPYPPTAMSGSEKFAAPCLRHLFGTDNFGRDIFSRVLAGAGTTFLISAATVVIGAAVGTLVGAFTGYFGGWLDEALMRINDAVTAFPSILLALVFISLLGFGKYNVILALGVAFVPSYARVIRSEFARHREMNYVKSARLMGAGHLRIMFLHILPNTRPVSYTHLDVYKRQILHRVSAALQLGSHIGIADDGPGHQLGEHGDIRRQVDEAPLGRGVAPVHVDDIAEDLKGIEADADGQGDPQQGHRQAGDGVEAGDQKVGVFAVAQKPQAQHGGQGQQQPPAGGIPLHKPGGGIAL